MNNIFAQSYATSMRTNRHSKLLRHQQYTQYLGDSCKSAGIDLAYIDSLCLQKLLEYHSVVCVLACGNPNTVRCEGPADGSVSKDIVRSCGLLNKPAHERINLRQCRW